MLVRLVIVTTLLLIATYVEAISENLLPGNPLYFVIGATYGLTVVHALGSALRSGVASGHVLAQVTGDLAPRHLPRLRHGGRACGLHPPLPALRALGSGARQAQRQRRSWPPRRPSSTRRSSFSSGPRPFRRRASSTCPSCPPRALAYSVFVTGLTCLAVGLSASYFAESLDQRRPSHRGGLPRGGRPAAPERRRSSRASRADSRRCGRTDPSRGSTPSAWPSSGDAPSEVLETEGRGRFRLSHPGARSSGAAPPRVVDGRVEVDGLEAVRRHRGRARALAGAARRACRGRAGCSSSSRT